MKATSQVFQAIPLLKDLANARKSGHLQIIANSVTWDFYFIQGDLQYASHSLQSVDTIKHYLLRLDWGIIAKIAPSLAKDIAPNNQFIRSVVKQLVDQNYLSANQRTILFRELTQDALESYLWLTDGKSQWHPINLLQSLQGETLVGENPLRLAPLLESLQTKLQAWQSLSPFITSPYQRPYCVNPSALSQKLPSDNLSPVILEKLVKLMRGLTIRELGLFLKQDDLKVAQLLFPYLKHSILQLHSPKPPLDKLPHIPSLPLKYQPSTVKTTSLNLTPTVTLVKSSQKLRKIACVDDSPTMLNMMKDYLGTEKYEIVTIEEPMNSVPRLFESKPDLILMDISMPGLNGNRFCQILKRSSVFQNVPIILVSGNTKLLTQETIQSVGASDYLAKPFTQGDLLAMVNKYLESD